MDVNGVSSYPTTPATSSTSTAAAKESTAKSNGFTDVAATYEHTSTSSTKKYTQNIDLVNQLKADAEARIATLEAALEALKK